MNSAIVKATFIVFSLMFSGAVFAQTSGSPSVPAAPPPPVGQRQEARDTTTQERKEFRQNTQQQRQDIRQDIQTQREDLRTQTVDQRRATTENIRSKRDAFLQDVGQKRDQFRDRMEQAREEFQQKTQEYRAGLKERLQTIRDERKREAVERVSDRFGHVNERITNHFLKALERLENILAKIRARADKAAENGHDISLVNSAIAAAQAAIKAARDAVSAQAGKIYEISVEGEENLGENVSETRHALNEDLKVTRGLVRKAHQAVIDALKTLKDIRGVDEEPATEESSGSSSPSGNDETEEGE